MSFDGVLTQVFQPYFYYSVLLLAVSFVCIKVLGGFTSIGPKTKSLLYLIPLVIPIAVLTVFVPQTTILTVTAPQRMDLTGNQFFLTAGNPPPITQGGVTVTISPITVFSYTGLICLVGLLAADFFAVSLLLADDRIARRFLHVISLSKADYPALQKTVVEQAKKLHIATPKVGVAEDLRPNAFTIGYGRRATVVFSIGLLNLLSEEETAAVASHELAHIKNSDFFHKLLSSTLTVASFFNPLAYLSSTAAQREREMLADQTAAKILPKPAALSTALAKICKTIQTLPRESMLITLSSNLLVTSSVLHRLGIFSTHPRLDKRLRNISEVAPHAHRSKHGVFFSAVLCLLLVGLAVTVTYNLVELQSSYATPISPHILGAHQTGVIGGGGPVLIRQAPSGQIITGSGMPGVMAQPNEGVGSVQVNDSLLSPVSSDGTVSGSAQWTPVYPSAPVFLGP